MDLTELDSDSRAEGVTIDPIVIQNIGVKTEPVTRGRLSRVVRATGTVAWDEGRIVVLGAKATGWIEQLRVASVGERLNQGDTLFALRSSELYRAQKQYKVYATRPVTEGTFGRGVQSQADNPVLKTVTDELLFLGATPAQLEALASGDPEQWALPVYSPISGLVLQNDVLEGQWVKAGMSLMRLVDDSHVWVLASVHESQLAYVRPGQRASLEDASSPGQPLDGIIRLIHPSVDSATHQATVRIDLDNPSNRLRAGMSVRVSLHTSMDGERTLVPREAVLDTGKRSVAIVSSGPGKFEARDVRVGAESDDGFIEVLDGLSQGELVVTSSQFLLDSEARLREALSRFGEHSPEKEASGPAIFVGPLAPSIASVVERILGHSLTLGDTLSRDTTEGLGDTAKALAGDLAALIRDLPKTKEWEGSNDLLLASRNGALSLIGSQGIEEARAAFLELSTSLVTFIEKTGVPSTFSSEVQALHCPMYGDDGCVWLQVSGEARNPYFGASMLRCFDERRDLAVTQVEGIDAAAGRQ